MGWRDIEMERDREWMRDDFEHDEVERAYKRGCEHGYRKAMEEMRSGYGERDGYGERGEYGDSLYGERRGVRGTGPYGRR